LHAQRHPAVYARLELEQQIQVQPLVGAADAPHQVVVTLRKPLADIARIDSFICRRIQPGQLRERREPGNQLLHQLGMREQ
jgi:hypothetical protein